MQTAEDCLETDPETWAEHVRAFRARALENMQLAVTDDRVEDAAHWRLMAEVLELDPRDWDGYGLLDRWDGGYQGSASDCSCGCVHYRPLAGHFAADWGVCTNPASHRAGTLTFEHQGLSRIRGAHAVTRRRSRAPTSPVVAGSPFLTRVALRQDRVQPGVYPFNIPLLTAGPELHFSTVEPDLAAEGCRWLLSPGGNLLQLRHLP